MAVDRAVGGELVEEVNAAIIVQNRLRLEETQKIGDSAKLELKFGGKQLE